MCIVLLLLLYIGRIILYTHAKIFRVNQRALFRWLFNGGVYGRKNRTNTAFNSIMYYMLDYTAVKLGGNVAYLDGLIHLTVFYTVKNKQKENFLSDYVKYTF